MLRILIIGATSAIAEATARRFADRGDHLYLLGRNSDRLAVLAKDLKVRGAGQVEYGVLDVNDFNAHRSAIEAAIEALKGLDIALIAHGTLPDQRSCEASFEVAKNELDTNAISSVSLLTHLANIFEHQRSGCLVVLSSVAGDRGRQSNYLYGAAKGMVTIFLQGLRNRLHRVGVHVLTVKPGFVDTPMTAAFDKGLLWAKPEEIAKGIEKAIERRRDVVYLPWFWRYIMLIIKLIPERIFKRLSM